ncbi:hypothetical protein E4U42_004703 [Claviceps africana]|uniref:Uncharacterized protein n=1 Tax=Claviceps africana TaxID=83212 RepID=A0A8K0J7M8_9HYPO|nr:hypothetical protein E4U42_004703 [Claviceps africana]
MAQWPPADAHEYTSMTKVPDSRGRMVPTPPTVSHWKYRESREGVTRSGKALYLGKTSTQRNPL